MKERILSRWGFVRIVWLVMGAGIVIQAVTEKNFLMLLPGVYFAFMALANTGCFTGGCARDFNTNTNNKKDTITEIEYGEVHAKK